jgi:hypothetical protein
MSSKPENKEPMNDKNEPNGVETISSSVIRSLNPSPFVVRPEKAFLSFPFGRNPLTIFVHKLLSRRGTFLQIATPGRPFAADSQNLKSPEITSRMEDGL